MTVESMTPEEQRNFERDALSGLADHLRTLGLVVAEVGHPEDEPSNPLNVDTEFLIDGERWAAEHTRIVYDHRALAAEEAAERYLRPKLARIADSHQVWLQLGFYAPRWAGKRRPTAAWDAMVVLAERAASTGSFVDDDRGNSVFARRGSPMVSFCFFASENAALGDQYNNALGAWLRSKLARQLPVAKENGYRVLLLLDQMPAPRGDPGTMWTPEHGTLGLVVAALLEKFPGIVDQTWLREAYGAFRLLVPNGGTGAG
jgi:hypothetical protein